MGLLTISSNRGEQVSEREREKGKKRGRKKEAICPKFFDTRKGKRGRAKPYVLVGRGKERKGGHYIVPTIRSFRKKKGKEKGEDPGAIFSLP